MRYAVKKHLRANLLLLVFTVILVCVIYPIILFAVGGTLFPSNATGSMATEKGTDGKSVVRGSHRIGQQFTDDAYFWPRPSATAVVPYNATASGTSNYGASNPALRNRVCQQIGPMVVYKSGSASSGRDREKPRTPQDDIGAWFASRPDRLVAWAQEFTTAASAWAKTDLNGDEYGLPGKFILSWADDHPEVKDAWKKDNPNTTEKPKPEDLVAYFFESFAKAHPGKWPGIVETGPSEHKEKKIAAVSSDSEIASGTPSISGNLFDIWLRDPANKSKAADLEPVAADMVMSSASGLDPDITARNALSVYQLDRVASKRKAKKEHIAGLVRSLSYTPLSGLVGEPLVNVFDLNRELDAKYPVP